MEQYSPDKETTFTILMIDYQPREAFLNLEAYFVSVSDIILVVEWAVEGNTINMLLISDLCLNTVS